MSKSEISEESGARIKAMYKIIGEMESLGDSGEAIARMLQRKNVHGKTFDEAMLRRLNKMMDLVENVPWFAFDYDTVSLKGWDEGSLFPFEQILS